MLNIQKSSLILILIIVVLIAGFVSIYTLGYTPGTVWHKAEDVKSGTFGQNVGGSNYNFPGNVGIGTTSSSSQLDVTGDIYATKQVTAGTKFKVGSSELSSSQLKVNGSSLVVTSTGNVGIGTTSPGAKLHVNGNIIANEPIAANHLATKAYVDSHGGLPTGGTDGAFLRMTSSGPIWDAPLTWPGSTKSVYDCVKIGGTEFDTGSGTICRLPSATVPAGWTQADNWARFDPYEWGGDDCGKHKSGTGTPGFANTKVVTRSKKTSNCSTGSWSSCSRCGWCTSFDGSGNPPYQSCSWNEKVIDHAEINRVEVGIY